MPHNMGLGGGFFMTVYVRETKTVATLNARETAPLATTKDMFKGNAYLSARGGLAIAVPGELRGYWEAHRRFGKLPWPEIVRPAMELCRKGHLITPYLAELLVRQEKRIRRDEGLRAVFINPKTDQPYKEGDYVKRPKLAETLRLIAERGPDVLYDGILTEQFVRDINAAGGIITVKDMNGYRPIWGEAVSAKLPFNQTLFTTPLPSSGIVLTFILNVLNGFLDYTNLDTVTNWQRIVETFKFAYAKRTRLGDPQFAEGIDDIVGKLVSPAYANTIRRKIADNRTSENPRQYGMTFSVTDDNGTAHVSVLAPNGDAVAVTSTINLYFGSGIRSPSTGIILNCEMDDFSIPGSFGIQPFFANYIAPGKRPLSSMCPTIIVDKNGDVVLVIGAAGGSKIISAVALVIMRHLWFNETLERAMAAPRLHHQLIPMKIYHEKRFNKEIIGKLSKVGHEMVEVCSEGFSALTAVSMKDGIVEGCFDWRRAGQVCLVGQKATRFSETPRPIRKSEVLALSE